MRFLILSFMTKCTPPAGSRRNSEAVVGTVTSRRKTLKKHLTNRPGRNKIAKGKKIHPVQTGVFPRKTFQEEDDYDSV